ncbi:rRNA maturation RNase YbeY [Wolbachia endosymbiont of Pentidionis agamae]|uniref:rRNA maturation RNase YbeY n=1 Tax=Wolbachia endosymbiont of Pentidionis agamae TaxID=3110435 RepID=UPI002FCEC072
MIYVASSIEINISDKRWYKVLKRPRKFVVSIINVFLEELGILHLKPSISVAMADDIFLHSLNLKYRKVDKSTNVLSFASGEETSDQFHLGDIAISVDMIERESKEYSIRILDHTAHMLVHGLLHLLGYDHHKEAEEIIMKDLENKILKKLNFEGS